MIVIILLFFFVSVHGRIGVGPTSQEWGYVTVRPGAHIFWWLHRTLAKVNHYTDRPLVIWVQGGPGVSGTGFGNFAIGPLNEDLKLRNNTWLNEVNVLFVDNPVGVGFSYADSPSALTINNTQIASDFVALLQGVYKALPELEKAKLYIFGESYGGKMAVDIALAIHKAVKTGYLKSNLVAIGLGDPWIAPMGLTLSWGEYLYSMGLVDENGLNKVDDAVRQTKQAFDQGQFRQSTIQWESTVKVVKSVAGDVDIYNVLTKIPWANTTDSLKDLEGLKSPYDVYMEKVNTIMTTIVKKSLNLNVTWNGYSEPVFNALRADFMKPVTNSIEILLNTTDISVAVYNGQLDLIVSTLGTMRWLNQIKYSQAEGFRNANRTLIVVDRIVEGFQKRSGNLAMYWINRCGHDVTLENYAALWYILRDVTKGFQG